MERFLTYIFIVNLMLILADASTGYHMAPYLARLVAHGEQDAAVTVQRLRKLLAWVVASLMFFNCYAYFQALTTLLLVVSGLTLLDMIGQFVIRWRFRHRGKT